MHGIKAEGAFHEPSRSAFRMEQRHLLGGQGAKHPLSFAGRFLLKQNSDDGLEKFQGHSLHSRAGAALPDNTCRYYKVAKGRVVLNTFYA
jgi:hypothetical protein